MGIEFHLNINNNNDYPNNLHIFIVIEKLMTKVHIININTIFFRFS